MSAAASLEQHVTDSLDDWDRFEIAYAEEIAARRLLAEAYAIHHIADHYVQARTARFERARRALTQALNEAVEAREELMRALDLAEESLRLVAMRMGR